MAELLKEFEAWLAKEERETGGEVGQSDLSDKVEEILDRAFKLGYETASGEQHFN